ncbi:MAG: hypothetical protein FJY85_23960, partial [Deltaproteobacteria bacterium]|nr:hypothetical protein [Deltaproteobacteria bacterium]
MSTNGFREDELITRKLNGQTRVFPVVGGRLRLAHEQNEALSLQTELVSWDGQYAVFKCCAATNKGQFIGYGTANAQRDARLSESLVELAETRSIARALRFAGYGLEFCGAEEISHVPDAEPVRERTANKATERVFQDGNGDGKPGSKVQRCTIDREEGDASQTPNGTGTDEGSRQERSAVGLATQAQCRALYALTKKARYADEDIENLLRPLEATRFQDLTREAASRLISYLQTEAA